jgi:predicted Rossmann fold nucleotide-binding protein DprA/Smf involved in DNA uptake
MSITAVVGSRTITDYNLVKDILDTHTITQIVSGGATGIDQLAERYSAKHLATTPIIIKPDWAKYGKQAGFLRNKDIIAAADQVIAIWDGTSKGTKNSINLAKKQNKVLHLYQIAGPIPSIQL